MRTFIALPLPDQIRDGLAKIQEGIPAGRLVDAENLHVTLVFLGDQPEGALEELHDSLEVLRAPSFDLTIHGLGTFGGARTRTLWAGIKPEPRLQDLQKSVSRAVRRAGIALEHRRFVPHVTLARFKDSYEEDAPFARFVAAEAGLTLPSFLVRHIALYASHLGKGGAHYEELAQYPLVS